MEMAEDQKFEKYTTDRRSEAAKHFPPIYEAQQIQMFHGTLKGAYYSHLMGHKSSFSEMIMAGKQVDLGIKLGRLESPTKKGEGESSRKTAAAAAPINGRRGKEASINAVNLGHPGSQQYSVNFTPAPPSTPAYAPSTAPGFKSSSADAINPSPAGPIERYDAIPAAHTVHTPAYPALPHIQTTISRQHDPTHGFGSQFHSGKPRSESTLPPNVQANPLPDHGSSSGPTINMISDCTMREDGSQHEDPAPFVIEYVPAEATVGFTGSSAAPAPFIIEVPAREPYQDSKGQVYTNPEIAGKGKAPAASGAAPEAPPIPQKKVTEEEVEAFMKVIKASEYKSLTEKLSYESLLQHRFPRKQPRIGLKRPIKFIADGRLITVKSEEDYAIYKETTVPYISIGDDENLPFHSFETISVIRDYGEVRPSRADRMVGKGQGINCPIEIEEYKNRRGLSFHPSCHEIIEARRGKHPHCLAAHYGKINRGIPVPSLSHFFPAPPHIIGGILDGPFSVLEDEPVDLSAICAVIEETPLGVHIRLAQENEEVPLESKSSTRRFELIRGTPRRVLTHILRGRTRRRCPEIKESLRRLKNRQFTLVEPTEEFNVGTEEEPHILKIGTGLDPIQRGRMIEFLTEYQEVFAWSYADMPGLDPSIVKHFLPLDTERFPPKRQHLRRQRAGLLLRIKKEVVKQINVGFLEVCNYSEWVANIVPVEKKDGKVRVRVDYRDLNKASPKDNFPLPHIDYKLRLNPAKCTFGAKSGKLLGFVVSERGIEVDPDKVKAIRELPPPSIVREVQGFLGRLNYIARFIANLIEKCQPLFRLLRKNAAIKWDEECQKAFDTIKAYLVQPLVLVPPTPDRPLILYLTVRRQSLGCMLGQKDESTHAEHVIYYLSKKFTEGESNYPEIEKMCCALLTEYDIEYVPRTSVKGQAIADHLAEFPIEDDTPINSDFPDEGILQMDSEENKFAWKMYFDGAVNFTGFGISAVLISYDGRYYPIAAKVDLPCTNNVAEYEACILALQAVIDFQVKELEVFGDSMLTIFQTLGQWKTKDAKLVPYHEYLEGLAENFEKISFTYTPRIKNQFADALATLASMVSITKENLIEPLEIEIAKGPAHCNAIEATDEQPWYEDIKHFLQTGQYPTFANQCDRK
ncbi:hypothetical protein CRG98_038154 [Punica granatum]|uniref:Uncharacterized protein n=1 Tax=Punica granatum TaxID=22663 RepID=A0A2I0IBT4_PUNGR|nr:hypothetical protein CRG98_038154 [Punica granatum]